MFFLLAIAAFSAAAAGPYGPWIDPPTGAAYEPQALRLDLPEPELLGRDQVIDLQVVPALRPPVPAPAPESQRTGEADAAVHAQVLAREG